MSLDTFQIIGMIAGIGTIILIFFGLIKFYIKISNYFDKVDKIGVNLKGINLRLAELEKKEYLLDFLLSNTYPKLKRRRGE